LTGTASDLNGVGCVSPSEVAFNFAGSASQGGPAASALTAAEATNALALGGVAASGYATLGANSFQGNQAITGNVAATGSVSAATLQGDGTALTSVVRSQVFRGPAGNIASGSTVFVFAGPTTTLTLTSSDKALVAASASLGVGSGSSEIAVDLDACYQIGAGSVTAPGGNYLNVLIPVNRKVFSVNNIFSGLTGTVKVGFCARNGTATALTGNDWVQGYALIFK